MSRHYCKRIVQDFTPTTEQAIERYEATEVHRGDAADYGHDPLADYKELKIRREQTFAARISDMNKVFYNLVNRRKDYLQKAIFAFVEITKSAFN